MPTDRPTMPACQGDPPMVLNFDGLCEPRNPGGWACYGWIVTRDGATVATGHGVAAPPGPGSTNNVAEYAALIAGLEALARLALDGHPVQVRGDSQLVICQMAGQWNCNAPRLRPLLARATDLAQRLGVRVVYRWIPRIQNGEADALSRVAYAEARTWPRSECSSGPSREVKTCDHNENPETGCDGPGCRGRSGE